MATTGSMMAKLLRPTGIGAPAETTTAINFAAEIRRVLAERAAIDAEAETAIEEYHELENAKRREGGEHSTAPSPEFERTMWRIRRRRAAFNGAAYDAVRPRIHAAYSEPINRITEHLRAVADDLRVLETLEHEHTKFAHICEAPFPGSLSDRTLSAESFETWIRRAENVLARLHGEIAFVHPGRPALTEPAAGGRFGLNTLPFGGG